MLSVPKNHRKTGIGRQRNNIRFQKGPDGQKSDYHSHSKRAVADKRKALFIKYSVLSFKLPAAQLCVALCSLIGIRLYAAKRVNDVEEADSVVNA